MRYEVLNNVASSAWNALCMFQQVVDDKEMQKLHQQTAKAFSSSSAAQPNLGGCVDSPEAATVLLLLVGAAGVYYGSSLFLRAMRRRGHLPADA